MSKILKSFLNISYLLSKGALRVEALLLIGLLCSGCAPVLLLPASAPGQVSAQLELVPYQPAAPCLDRFIEHELDFITNVDEQPVRLFASNGSGLAVSDLNQNGRLDLVFANLDGQNAVLWNEGDLVFRREDLPVRNTRAVSAVDVDGDGWSDIVFALRRFLPAVMYNEPDGQGGRTFSRQMLSLFPDRTYVMAWADMDGDHDLDAVVATYDAERQKEEGIMSPSGGVFLMSQDGLTGQFTREPLAYKAQALAILLEDFNADGRPDILVGQDFEVPDQVWLRTTSGWEEKRVFDEVTRNTMSFAPGDLDNDGDLEIFAADMKPFKTDAETMAQWMPLMEDMDFEVTGGQVMHNVLQVMGPHGIYEDKARGAALEATGWTWSAQFGDLNNDGLLDLYVVNGMQAQEMFPHLENAELVEENLVFRNAGESGFQWMPDWGLNSKDGGRSMAMADLDLDGDLDIVVNNLLDPAILFENRLCAGQSLSVELLWPGQGNTLALGAEVILHTDQGILSRSVRSNSGYLTGEPTRLHFGLPNGAALGALEVRWPDGQITQLTGLSPQVLLRLTRLE